MNNLNGHIGATVDKDFVEIEVVVDEKKIFDVTMPLAAFSVDNLKDAIDHINNTNDPSNTQIYFADERVEFHLNFYKQDIRICSRENVEPKFWFRMPLSPLKKTLLKMLQHILAQIEKK